MLLVLFPRTISNLSSPKTQAHHRQKRKNNLMANQTSFLDFYEECISKYFVYLCVHTTHFLLHLFFVHVSFIAQQHNIHAWTT